MDYKASQMARAAAATALQAANPHLVPISACKGGSLIAASKNMKIELGRAFPGVKFSIKTRRFSGGDAIDVSWIDGPTSKQVDEIIDRYSAGSFNGMEDISEYSRNAWIEAFGDAKYVHSQRRMSDEAIAKAIRLARAKYGAEVFGDAVTVEAYRKGALWNVQFAGGWGRENMQQLISDLAYRQCWALTKPYISAAQAEEVDQ